MFGRAGHPKPLREDAWSEPPFGSLVLRKLKKSDKAEWHAVRLSSYDWLKPWEATVAPTAQGREPNGGTYDDYIRALNDAAKSGDSYMWGIFMDNQFAGQISLGSISYGSLRGAHVGYWVAKSAAGRGIAPTAVAMVMDYAFTELSLHRIEVNIRPENRASVRVAEKLGLRYEGLRKDYLHINGEWADHAAYAITASECPQGMMYRWRETV